MNGRVFASRIKVLMAVGSKSILSGFANTHATFGFAVGEERAERKFEGENKWTARVQTRKAIKALTSCDPTAAGLWGFHNGYKEDPHHNAVLAGL